MLVDSSSYNNDEQGMDVTTRCNCRKVLLSSNVHRKGSTQNFPSVMFTTAQKQQYIKSE